VPFEVAQRPINTIYGITNLVNTFLCIAQAHHALQRIADLMIAVRHHLRPRQACFASLDKVQNQNPLAGK
jgi:hypothetical protein